MILSILLFPKIKIGKISIDTYWIVTLIVAIILLACGKADIVNVGKALISDTAINPVKILVLSMFVLIVVLNEQGITYAIGEIFGDSLPILKYGAASFISANLINNIPMSVLFSSIIESTGGVPALRRCLLR